MDQATQAKLEALWTENTKAQKAEFDAMQAADKAREALHDAEERYRVARHNAHNARGRLHLLINEDAGIPGDEWMTHNVKSS